MSKNKTTTTAVLSASLFLALAPTTQALAQQPAPAAAPPAALAAPAIAPDELLKRSDDQASAFKDASFHFKMRILDGAQAREIEFTTLQKGKAKRLVRFLKPADIAGMGFLSESADVMYAMLPAYGNRIRRLGTSQMNQAFMGSDLSSSDMSPKGLAEMYTATQVGTEGELAILALALRPGQAAEWPRLKVWIDAKTAVLHKMEYQDASGKKLRTAARSDFKKDEATGFLTPGKMVYTDHRRNDHQTELILIKAEFNKGLSDDQFSQRALQRGG